MMHSDCPTWRIGAYACLAILSCAATAHAAPTISKVSLPGLQTGATTTIVVEGADLGADSRLILPVPVAIKS